MSWEQELFEPIELPDGRVLRTLRDAGHFIQDLPKATHDRPDLDAYLDVGLLAERCSMAMSHVAPS